MSKYDYKRIENMSNFLIFILLYMFIIIRK